VLAGDRFGEVGEEEGDHVGDLSALRSTLLKLARAAALRNAADAYLAETARRS
jgi:hypothetical protein